MLEEKVKQLIGPERYKRTQKRKGYRNGYYRRVLLTNYGDAEGLQVPRVIGLQVESDVFECYQHQATSIEAAIGCLFFSGVSRTQAAEKAWPATFPSPFCQSPAGTKAWPKSCVIMTLAYQSGSPFIPPTSSNAHLENSAKRAPRGPLNLFPILETAQTVFSKPPPKLEPEPCLQNFHNQVGITLSDIFIIYRINVLLD